MLTKGHQGRHRSVLPDASSRQAPAQAPVLHEVDLTGHGDKEARHHSSASMERMDTREEDRGSLGYSPPESGEWPFGPAKPGLEAKGGRSKYVHPETGERMPSVTTVLGLKSKPALEWHAIRLCIQETFVNPYDPENESAEEAKKRFEAARWGTTSKGYAAHALIQRGVPVAEAEEPLRGFLSAAYEAMEHHGLSPVAHEAVVWGDGYAGSADMIAVDAEGRTVLVDWKTTTKDDGVVYADSMLQVAAYANAQLVSTGDGLVYDMGGCDKAMVVSISETGRWRSSEMEGEQLMKAYQQFRRWQKMLEHDQKWESQDFNDGPHAASGGSPLTAG